MDHSLVISRLLRAQFCAATESEISVYSEKEGWCICYMLADYICLKCPWVIESILDCCCLSRHCLGTKGEVLGTRLLST